MLNDIHMEKRKVTSKPIQFHLLFDLIVFNLLFSVEFVTAVTNKYFTVSSSKP